MICPECGTQKTSVIKTMVVPGQCSRMRECACGVRFFTVEKVTCRVAPATAGQPPRNHGQPPVTTGNPPATTGGKGGGLSLVSGSDLDPESSPSLISNSVEIVSKRRRGTSRVYTPDFEVFWKHTGSCYGNKGTAFDAFGRVFPGTSVEALCAAWDAYMQSSGPVNAHVQHVSSWLNGSGHQTTWKPANARPGANGSVPGPSQPRREDPYCEAHSSFGKNLPSTRQSYREKPGCPSCQEYRARYAGRTGEPESMGDLLARMGK